MDWHGHRVSVHFYALILFVLMLVLLGILAIKNMPVPGPVQTYTIKKTAQPSILVKPSSSLLIPSTVNNDVLGSDAVKTCITTKTDTAKPAPPALVSSSDLAAVKQYNKAMGVWLTDLTKWVDAVPQTIQTCYNDELAKKYSVTSADYTKAKW